jgi:HSP20 family protein
MLTLTPWNPFNGMEELNKQLACVFNPAYRRNPMVSGDENIVVPEWTPAVDIVEDEKEYLIKLDLPEVAKEDVKVTVEAGSLTISGERKAEKEEKNRKFHRVERFFGRFERSFVIPEDADETKVNAEFKEGVLRVRLAKSEKAHPRQIDVKVG